jgi:hypothetical protein
MNSVQAPIGGSALHCVTALEASSIFLPHFILSRCRPQSSSSRLIASSLCLSPSCCVLSLPELLALPLSSAPPRAPIPPLLVSLSSRITNSEIALHAKTECLRLHTGVPSSSLTSSPSALPGPSHFSSSTTMPTAQEQLPSSSLT